MSYVWYGLPDERLGLEMCGAGAIGCYQCITYFSSMNFVITNAHSSARVSMG